MFEWFTKIQLIRVKAIIDEKILFKQQCFPQARGDVYFHSFLFIHQKSMYQLRKAVFMNITDDYQVFAPISSEKSDAKLFI